jgi:hypothetical protein
MTLALAYIGADFRWTSEELSRESWENLHHRMCVAGERTLGAHLDKNLSIASLSVFASSNPTSMIFSR